VKRPKGNGLRFACKRFERFCVFERLDWTVVVVVRKLPMRGSVRVCLWKRMQA
jgi:hypothetical protein